ncbi:MAG: glucosaminidase domain-containing protein [Bacteroidia bacterium]
MKTIIKATLIIAGVFTFAGSIFAQPAERKNTPQDYINKYSDDARREMMLYKVPASITLAQGMLESDNGNSALAVYANNHFGIKCHKEWNGETFIQDDDEKNECFRKYASVYESYVDHSQFLKSRQRYAALFELKITDYKGWAKGLKECGYATDPKYADRLISIIERYKLYEFDKLEEMPPLVAQPRQDESKNKVTASVHRREVLLNNNVKYVIVKPGDSFSKIAKELDMEVWQLYKYNELGKDAQLKAGQMLYIQPKRRKSKEKEYIVKPGDTAYSISQQFGIKTKHLYRLNHLESGATLKAGQVLQLRKKKR